MGSDGIDRGQDGCTAETGRPRVRQAEKETGNGRERIKALEREVRQANEILRKASAYFARAELDRPFRR